MAAAVTVTGTKNADETLTISLTGFGVTTAYNVRVTTPSGAVYEVPVTTDGAGAASTTYRCSVAGTMTVDVRSVPASVATVTATIGNPASV